MQEESDADSDPLVEANDDVTWLPPGQSTVHSVHYYAVFFLQKIKKTFYLGLPIHVSSDLVTMKFLEKKLSGDNFVYDWPKRPDICQVDMNAILQEVKFNGPPPHQLEKKITSSLNEKAQRFQLP